MPIEHISDSTHQLDMAAVQPMQTVGMQGRQPGLIALGLSSCRLGELGRVGQPERRELLRGAIGPSRRQKGDHSLATGREDFLKSRAGSVDEDRSQPIQ